MVSTCLTSSAAIQGYFKVYYFHSSIYRTGDPCEFRARSLAGLWQRLHTHFFLAALSPSLRLPLPPSLPFWSSALHNGTFAIASELWINVLTAFLTAFAIRFLLKLDGVVSWQDDPNCEDSWWGGRVSRRNLGDRKLRRPLSVETLCLNSHWPQGRWS